ncbi:hypothetical protein MUP77_22995 [Candidatus Bathyarchaeota archaeon]|nr:hypothetical protein [Candidatus Bathyarchaeota archaeon]
METQNKRYIEIDIESFFHFSYSILNIIAKLTPMFYKPVLQGLKSKDFNPQRKWFIKHPEKDKEYSEYLRTNTSWFEDLEEDRTQLAHHQPLITFRSTEHILTFGTHWNKREGIDNYPVLDYVNEKSNGLLEFVIFYDKHFGK